MLAPGTDIAAKADVKDNVAPPWNESLNPYQHVLAVVHPYIRTIIVTRL